MVIGGVMRMTKIMTIRKKLQINLEKKTKRRKGKRKRRRKHTKRITKNDIARVVAILLTLMMTEEKEEKNHQNERGNDQVETDITVMVMTVMIPCRDHQDKNVIVGNIGIIPAASMTNGISVNDHLVIEATVEAGTVMTIARQAQKDPSPPHHRHLGIGEKRVSPNGEIIK